MLTWYLTCLVSAVMMSLMEIVDFVDLGALVIINLLEVPIFDYIGF